MELFEALHERRSIRKYIAGKDVSDEQVETILRAAMIAPSAGNAQPWRFVVIRDRALLEAVAVAHPHAKMATEAPLAILVCGDPSLARFPALWPQDCSAATQNILLAVHGLGLGAVWCGVYPNEERVAAFKELFNMPEGVEPFSLVPIGYPGEAKGDKMRFKPDRIVQNKF